MTIRIGNGFDVHALGTGNSVILCGIKIQNDYRLIGHSDADVALHALTDAILGAIAAGDIGHHFPPSDDKWVNADSSIFVKKSIKLMEERNYKINNIDLTIICEKPKIEPHSKNMRQRVAELCKVNINQVSIKATTSERLGFTGRNEGIASLASVLVQKNE